ncbi:DUF2231 domain-containing protein [Cryobacterium sp.]|jgi:uncharacterized membrane protein|uniref:DUF2231 domain-containing protein n=1 Tax=Cryobacterium sp. TaxID=1926290 RepID=UPI0026313D6A|nr:DUF2231 domain-containing protein [Cryobacterium sp.]MCU1445441.1 hypothetical protein [Cryobacterium sp.]
MSDEAALRRAKRPRSILAGPYGHPIHAIMVTIPIGSWTAALIFDIVGFFADDRETFTRGALWLVGIGIVGALLAAIVGLLDLSTLEKGTRARRTALFHLACNAGAIVLFAVSYLVRLGADKSEVSVTGFVLSVLAYLLIGVSGILGGELVYRHGVRVADEATQIKAYRH